MVNKNIELHKVGGEGEGGNLVVGGKDDAESAVTVYNTTSQTGDAEVTLIAVVTGDDLVVGDISL